MFVVLEKRGPVCGDGRADIMGGDVGVPLQKGLVRQRKGQGDFSDVSASEVKSVAGSCRMRSSGCLLRQDRGSGLELS